MAGKAAALDQKGCEDGRRRSKAWRWKDNPEKHRVGAEVGELSHLRKGRRDTEWCKE